jgi:pyruvate,orthophosphate dikinase
LLGFATVDRLVVSLVTSARAVQVVIDALPAGRVNQTPRGLQVTVDGRRWLAAQLDAERDGIERTAADRLYRQFILHDDHFKRLVADWQVRVVDGREALNDHADSAYDTAVRERLCAFHHEASPLFDDICALAARLRPYPRRFVRASAAVASGDGSMIASPLKDSYHTVWFELHEELMHLSGRSRAIEETNAAARTAASQRKT